MSEASGRLEALFIEAESELSESAFTASVVARTRKVRFQILAGIALLFAVVIGVAAALSVPFFEFAVTVSAVMTNPIVDVGEGWLGFLLAPINNCGAIVIVVVKIARMILRRARRWSWDN